MPAPPDPVDAILLRVLAGTAPEGPVAVVDDEAGALVEGVADLMPGVSVRVSCDSLTQQRAVAAVTARRAEVTVVTGLGEELFDGVQTVVLRLPKSLAALDETAAAVVRHAGPDVELFGGARVKHMNRGMNDVLAAHFHAVRASLGSQKSRVLIAAEPRPGGPDRYPLSAADADTGLEVRAFGGTFAGTALDLGTRFLIGLAARFPADARTVVDLGCGTGLLAVTAARALPGASVLAVDDSWAAVRSARATALVNGVAERVEVRRSTLLEGVPDRSVDLVLCNPPFHRGNTRDSAVAFEMLADAARTLRLGGELWTVYNSHLPYLRTMRRLIGPTVVVAQNAHYTVTRSVQSP